ncbi:hypothetical protein [Cytobacillus gottheilii]|uniref:WYL domain-containing protein n=1 Tax=Cytobacillus gottheilii TaxID=859144 RepID=A0ABX8FBS4_9BACI|nr:hypothetical protein [Cytobacillus gottheilii]QVY60911.1 hypothetical protein J1899_18350 [Cytobacillus gottheilii]
MKGLLMRAAGTGEELEMIYQDHKGNISQRKVKVLTVNEESFHAYCFIRRQQRTFKLNNTLSIAPARKMRRGA